MSAIAKPEQLPVGTGKVINGRKLCSGDLFRAPGGVQIDYCIKVDPIQDTLHTVRLCDLKTREVFDPDEPVIVVPLNGRRLELCAFVDEVDE
jgi:hypothetical protein